MEDIWVIAALEIKNMKRPRSEGTTETAVEGEVVPVLIGGCCGCWAVTHWEGGSSRFQESAVQGTAGFNGTIITVRDPQQELNDEPFFFYVKLLVCITKHDGIPGELAVQ